MPADPQPPEITDRILSSQEIMPTSGDTRNSDHGPIRDFGQFATV
jgi:hypothetical protein